MSATEGHAKGTDMRVWIIEMGEDHEGGNITGVYATRDLAKADFAKHAHDLYERFGRDGFDDAQADADGSIYLHDGCDWLTLHPFGVVTQAEIAS